MPSQCPAMPCLAQPMPSHAMPRPAMPSRPPYRQPLWPIKIVLPPPTILWQSDYLLLPSQPSSVVHAICPIISGCRSLPSRTRLVSCPYRNNPIQSHTYLLLVHTATAMYNLGCATDNTALSRGDMAEKKKTPHSKPKMYPFLKATVLKAQFTQTLACFLLLSKLQLAPPLLPNPASRL